MITHRHSRSVRLRALAALLGALSALLLVAGVAPAQASHIFCGAILGPGIHVLESDLGPCPVGFPALTLNSATLILNEFTVRCAPSTGSTVGIAVQGKESWLGFGFVENCTFGVVLAGVRRTHGLHGHCDRERQRRRLQRRDQEQGKHPDRERGHAEYQRLHRLGG